MVSFSMEELHDGGRARLVVAGELDLATADAFAQRARQLCADGSKLLVDLSAVEFMDSRGLRALEDVTNEVRQAGGELEVSPELTQQVRRLFEIMPVRIQRRHA